MILVCPLGDYDGGFSETCRAAQEQDNTILLLLLPRSCKFLKISLLSWSCQSII